MKKIEKILSCDGRVIRFTNFIDQKSISFEALAVDFMANAAIEQTVSYLSITKRKFYLLQIESERGIPLMQACVFVGRPKYLPFASGTVPNLHHAKNAEEAKYGLKVLRELSSEIPELMTLRIQPKRFSTVELNEFEEVANALGFLSTDPMGPTRTLMLDLCESSEALNAKLPSKTRAKIRHAGRSKVMLKVLTDAKYAEVCHRASTASRARSGASETTYDFEGIFEIAKKDPNRAHIVGIFMNDRPEELLAYVIGYKNGSYCEYSAAGGFSDPELRSLPYNYFLMWDLINWARSVGCAQMDMGGITDGSANDPLQGISRFKRSITEQELEVGREVITVLKPLRFFVYRALKGQLKFPKIKTKIQTEAAEIL